MAHHPLIKPNDKNRAVLRAKRLTIAHLIKFGKKDLANDINPRITVYGPEAVKGVKYVQRRFKLKVDGVIGPNTWKVLEYAATKPQVPVLTIIPREKWSARTPRGVDMTKWGSKTPTRVHHTVTPKPKGSGAELINAEHEALRQIQKYHMDTRKYVDIAYNFLIMPSGRVYEGRGRNVVGAHTLGHNEDCGIAFVGDYSKDTLTRAQITAFNLLRRKLGISGGPKAPHSATYNTSCPGDNVVKQLGL